MRVLLSCFLIYACCFLAEAQGNPPADPPRLTLLPQAEYPNEPLAQVSVADSSSARHRMTLMIKRQINKAIDGKFYPELENWRPLSTREKFDRFLVSTHSPRTFAAAGVDALKSSTIKSTSPEFERGLMGFGQHFGVSLGVSETELFLERFLVPSLLKQDPRYFRDPRLPFFRRALYSMSRVFITRADSGHETFNASRILGGAASQSLADLYVPGRRQGLSPIVDRITFDLIRDTGFNLIHEFWPDLRRKILHR
jgi:hypothetical protein